MAKKVPKQLDLFHPPRVRDYAKERAQRDAKYQALGFRSYNQRETQRRNAKAQARGYSSYGDYRKAMQTVDKLTNQIFDKLSGAIEFDIPDDTPDYWDDFRERYSDR